MTLRPARRTALGAVTDDIERCQIDLPGGAVAITIWSGWNDLTPAASARSGR